MRAGLTTLVRIVYVLLAILGAAVVVVTFTPVLRWWSAWLTGDRWEIPRGEILIVLAADGENAGGTMGYSSYWRAVYAANAWREGGWKTVIVSGSGSGGASIRDYLVSHGIPAEAVLLEDRSTSTRENALFTTQLLREHASRPVLMTSDFHMRRARGCFAAAGIEVTPVPVPDAMKRYQQIWNRWWVFTDLLVETLKLAAYKLPVSGGI